MRDYAKVPPQFWTSKTGKALKKAGPEAVIVALYLETSPHANMIGVYHCPIEYIAIDTGLGIEGASKGLQSAIEAGFCTFDADADSIFVHDFAACQIGDELKPDDKRCIGVRNEVAKVPDGPCKAAFLERYGAAFHLTSEAPSKSLESQEQEQKQEQKQEQEQKERPARRATTSPGPSKPEDVSEQTWADFLALRKGKRAVVTETVLSEARAEAAKAGLTLERFLALWCARGSQGLQAEWLKPNERSSSAPASRHSGFETKDYRQGVDTDGILN